MAIVRNKKAQPVDPSAIAAFGAEAEAKPSIEAQQKTSTPSIPRKQRETKPPASSLIRWDGHEDLRDALIEYARRERYPVHTVLIMALEQGLEHLGEPRR